jgi:hypothetical protein
VLGLGGRWADVEPVPGAFLINIGDLMARYEPVLAGPHLMGKFRRSVTVVAVDNAGRPGETHRDT